jgi:flagellar biosynthesis/type III secretory pathway protein FliH
MKKGSEKGREKGREKGSEKGREKINNFFINLLSFRDLPYL